MKKLDFLVIGTTKGGTTTLFEWLREHPAIHIPKGKEIPYFSDDEAYHKGMKWYLDTYFADANANQLWGTVSPQYMWGQRKVTVEEVAKRIKKDTPHVKLIAILRDPIERAYSHHKMYRRWQTESRTFDSAMRELMQQDNHARSHREIYTGDAKDYGLSGPNNYLVASEYGRSLEAYYKLFDPSQIRVYFSSELRNERERVVGELFEFLDVDTAFQPKNLTNDYHKGGAKPKVSWLGSDAADRIPVVGPVWKKLPKSFRQRVAFAIHRWNVKPDSSTLTSSSQIYKDLQDFLKEDTELLEQLLGRQAPWKER